MCSVSLTLHCLLHLEELLRELRTLLLHSLLDYHEFFMCFILCKEVKYHAVANATLLRQGFLLAVVAAVLAALITALVF